MSRCMPLWWPTGVKTSVKECFMYWCTNFALYTLNSHYTYFRGQDPGKGQVTDPKRSLCDNFCIYYSPCLWKICHFLKKKKITSSTCLTLTRGSILLSQSFHDFGWFLFMFLTGIHNEELLVTLSVQTRAGVPAATHCNPSVMEDIVLNQVHLHSHFLSQRITG